ncbi:hypothetical protein HO887_10185, partial [Streptococcus suis]|nr:hypothetical protein [Streptococcus suis]NQQ09970.1 hypothetical protein [Streptococcus suis]
MRRLVLNIAMSLDGFIARKDGSYDWIDGHGTDKYDTVSQFDNQKFFRGWAKRPTSLLRVRVNISAQWLIGRFVRVLHSKSDLINCARGREDELFFYHLSSPSRYLTKNILSSIVKISKLFYFGLKFSVKSAYKTNTL